jgi:hypothetical protein
MKFRENKLLCLLSFTQNNIQTKKQKRNVNKISFGQRTPIEKFVPPAETQQKAMAKCRRERIFKDKQKLSIFV